MGRTALAAEQLIRCLFANGSTVARRDAPKDSEPTARLEPDDIADWPGIAELAFSHDLAPLLFKRLKQANRQTAIPHDVWDRLRLSYFACARKNARLFHRLGSVLTSLRKNDIPVIVFKGAYLAGTVYRDTASRPMNDVDLLVPTATLPKVRTVMIEAGSNHQSVNLKRQCRTSHQIGLFYFPPTAVRKAPAVSEPPGGDSAVIHSSPDNARNRPASGSTAPLPGWTASLAVEIHWTIIEPVCPFSIPVDELWDRSRPVEVAGVSVLTLSPEDQLLNICVNAVYRDALNGGLRPFCDAGLLIEHFGSELNWSELIRRARAWGVARHVGLALALVRDLSAADLPDGIPDRLVPGGIERSILDTAKECIFAKIHYRRMMPVSIRKLFSADYPANRLRRLRNRLATSKTFRKGPMKPPVSVLAAVLAVVFAPFMAGYRICSLVLARRLVLLLSRAYDREMALAHWLDTAEQ